MFKKRPNFSAGVISGMGNPPSDDNVSRFEDGDTVTLTLVDSDERVIVDNIKWQPDSKLKGTIRGFEPSVAVEFGELKIGDVVEFNEDEVFFCIKN